MKCFGFILLLGSVSFGAIGGCSGGGGQDGSQALTENDFVEDPSLSAIAGGGVVVHFLEPPAGMTAQRDTGDPGIDIIPIRYNRTTEHNYCWEDDDPGAAHSMALVDSEGQVLLTVQANGDCATEIIERGNYEMRLSHDGLSQDTHPIFIRPVVSDQDARNTPSEQGIIKTVKRIFKGTLQSFGMGTEAMAQTVQQNIETLLQTRRCITCDLKKANLRGANLSSVNVEGSNFEDADLMNADFNCAVLRVAVFRQANMVEVNLACDNPENQTSLVLADLSDAVLAGANATGATFEDANLSQADLREANFNRTILRMANLTGVMLDNTTFDSAAWCVGFCNCSENSIDQCVGCAPISTCTGS